MLDLLSDIQDQRFSTSVSNLDIEWIALFKWVERHVLVFVPQPRNLTGTQFNVYNDGDG